MNAKPELNSLVPYVPGKKVAGAIKLASNENPLGSSPLAMEALRNAEESLSVYPDGAVAGLTSAIAEFLDVSPSQIVVGNGSDEVMMLTAAAYLRRGDTTITAEHTFSQYTFVSRLFGAEVTSAPMTNGTFNLSEIRSRIDSSTRAIFICNPNNPTGTYVGKAALTAFIERVPEDVLVVLDEAYHDFTDAPDFPDGVGLVRRFPNILVLRTFSKIYGLAGLRVGYGVTSAKIAANLQKVRQPFNSNSLAQAAATAALSDRDFVKESVSNNLRGRQSIYDLCEELDLFYYQTQANFVCINVEYDAEEIYARLVTGGVTVRALGTFGLPTWIRVTIGTPEQNEVFARALRTALSEQGRRAAHDLRTG